MPYSVPRRRTRQSSHQQVESSSDGGRDQPYAPGEEEGLASPSSSSSRLLHPLPINVLSSQQPSTSTPRRKQRTATPSQTPATLSRSPLGGVSSAPIELPTPPDSFSEQGSVSRVRKRKNNNDSSRFENTPTPSRTPPPPAKRTRGSVSAQRETPSSSSKGRHQHEQHNNTSLPDRSMRARSNRVDPSMSTFSWRMSPQTELSLLQDQSAPTGFYDDLSEDDEDEVFVRDRCIYLPTRRTRDLSRSRNLSNMTMSPRMGLMRKGNAATTLLSGEEGEDLQKTIIEERREEEEEQEHEAHAEPEPEAGQDVDQPWSTQDAASLPVPNDGDYDGVQDMPFSDEGGDAVVPAEQQCSDRNATVNEKRDVSKGEMEQSPRHRSPLSSVLQSEALGSFDELFSPNARRDLPATISIPMESTPFALGKRPVQGRRSTPHHLNQERKVRESLAALNSPHKAQRVPGEKRIIDLAEIRLSSSPLGNSSPNLQSRSTLKSLQSLSLDPPRRSKEREGERERELSTVLAQEASDDDSSDQDDHLSHFTIVANTTAKMMTPAKGRPEAGEAEEDEEDSTMSIPRESQHSTLNSRLREESEEILADDFVYETVIVDDVDRRSSPAGEMSRQVREATVELVQDAEEYMRSVESPQIMLGEERRQQHEESEQEEEMVEEDSEEEEMEVEEAEEEQEEMEEEDEAPLAVEEDSAVEEMEEEEEREEQESEEDEEDEEEEEEFEEEMEEDEEEEPTGSDGEEAVERRPSISSIEEYEADDLSHDWIRSPHKDHAEEAPGGTSLARRIEVTQDSSSDEEDSTEDGEQDESEDEMQDEELDEEQEEISPARGSYDDKDPRSESEDGIASEVEDDVYAEERDISQSPSDPEEDDEGEGDERQSDSERGDADIEAAMNNLDEEELRYRALEEISEPSLLMRAGEDSRGYSREDAHLDDEEEEGEEGEVGGEEKVEEEESVQEEEVEEEDVALAVEYEESEEDIPTEDEYEEEERDRLEETEGEDGSASEGQGGDEDLLDRMDGEAASLSRSSPKSVECSRQEALSESDLPFIYDDGSRVEFAPIKETVREPRHTPSVHEASPVIKSTSRTWAAMDDSSRRRNVVESSRLSMESIQSHPSSPLVMEVRYNPAEDMSIGEEEVARRQRQQAAPVSQSRQQQQHTSSDGSDEHSRFGRPEESPRQRVKIITPVSVALSAMGRADGSKSMIQSRIVNDTVMTDDANTTVADYMRDRVERLAATPTTIEITSLNPEVAAKCVAILQEHHKYLQCGRLDAEVEEDQGSLSVYPVQEAHSVRKDPRPLVDDRPRQSPRQQRPIRDYSPIEAEPRSVAKRNILIDDKTTASTSGSPRTPSLPGAFPGARMANGTPSRHGIRAGSRSVEDTRNDHSPLPPNSNAETFSKQDWRLLDKIAEEHVRARARHLQQTSQVDKGEALLQAAASLDRTPIADAFFAVRRGIEAEHLPTSWDEQAIDIKIRAVVRKFLRGLQRKHPHLDVESHLSMVEGSTMVVGEGVSVYPVDESGVTDSSLHVPFRLVTESTPAPKDLNNRALHHHHRQDSSPSAVERSTSINIYPRIPSPIGQSRVKSTIVDSTTTTMQSQQGNTVRHRGPPREEDNSMSIIGLVSKSLESVRASLRWGAARVEAGPSVEKPITAARHIAITSVPASADDHHCDMSEVNHRPLHTRSFLHDTSTASTSMNRSSSNTIANNTSQAQYRSGSSRLINSGASSNVDPTALAYLSPHTHGLAKAKAQQFKQAREARNWKSPRRSQLRERASGVNTTTHNNISSSSNSTTLPYLPLR